MAYAETGFKSVSYFPYLWTYKEESVGMRPDGEEAQEGGEGGCMRGHDAEGEDACWLLWCIFL